MKEKKERKINRRVDGSSKSSSKKTEGGSLIFLLNYLFFLPLHAAKYFTVSFFIFISWEERTYVYCNYQIWDSSCIQFLKTLMQSHLVYYSPQRRFIRKCFWQIPSSSSLFAVICQKEFSFFSFFHRIVWSHC